MTDKQIHFYEFGEFRLDVINEQLLRGERDVEITNKSLKVLQFLIEHRGEVLKKEHLIDALWEGVYVEEKTLMQHIYMLRKALKKDSGNETYIKTISKNGYSFIAEVKEVFIESSETNDNSSKTSDEISEVGKDSAKSVSATNGNLKQIATKSDKKINRRFVFSRRFAFVAVASLIFVSSVIFAFSSRQVSNANADSGQIESIAVLPFQQFGDYKKDEKLGLIIADILTSEMGKFDKVSVSPMSSVAPYAGEGNIDLFDVGEKLDVDAVVGGTIQKDGNRVRVAVRLYSVRDKKQIWAETFDERFSGSFSLQDKINRRISSKLAQNIPSLHNEFIQMQAAIKIEESENSCDVSKKKR